LQQALSDPRRAAPVPGVGKGPSGFSTRALDQLAAQRLDIDGNAEISGCRM
jgi:hypothetical protein